MSDIKSKKLKDLAAQYTELKQELSGLRVAQVTNGAASKLTKIYVVRKNIARVKTVMNEQARTMMRKQVEKKPRVPKQLRKKQTRAIRRALTPKQVSRYYAAAGSSSAPCGAFRSAARLSVFWQRAGGRSSDSTHVVRAPQTRAFAFFAMHRSSNAVVDSRCCRLAAAPLASIIGLPRRLCLFVKRASRFSSDEMCTRVCVFYKAPFLELLAIIMAVRQADGGPTDGRH